MNHFVTGTGSNEACNEAGSKAVRREIVSILSQNILPDFVESISGEAFVVKLEEGKVGISRTNFFDKFDVGTHWTVELINLKKFNHTRAGTLGLLGVLEGN